MIPHPHANETMTSQTSEGPVLIVEDDPDIAETLAVLLDERGHRVETAVNGVEALARLRRPPRPALILLDLAMPVMDGRQFRRAQLEEPELASIPVVVLTADAHAPGPGLGAIEWLLKPVSLDSLLEVVARHSRPRDLSESPATAPARSSADPRTDPP